MNVGFATFDVVVQIVTEEMNQINGIFADVFVRMPWKQD
jgi:hypothetical protein